MKRRYQIGTIEPFKKLIDIFFKRFNRTRAPDEKVKYVLVYEEHKKGGWHAHGVLLGLRMDELIFSGIEHKGRKVYNWPALSEDIGFNEITKISSKKRTASYMCKYITKAFSESNVQLGKQVYSCSKGLKRAEIIAQGHFNILDSLSGMDSYSNEFCTIWKTDNIDFIS